jgi:hypothetical protein
MREAVLKRGYLKRGKSMQYILKTLMISFFSIFICNLLFGCSATTKTLPIREIDRPLNAPAGTKQVSTSVGISDNSGGWNILSHLLTPTIQYAITDKLTFPNLPFPILQCQIRGSHIYSGDTAKTPEFALAVFGGAAASSVNRVDYNVIKPQIGIVGKRLLGKNLWLSFNLSSWTENSDYLWGYAASNVGYQLGNKNSINVGLDIFSFTTISADIDTSLWGENRNNSGLVVFFPIGWKLNLSNQWFFKSALSPGFNYRNNKLNTFESWDLQLGCNW